jgi:hypothetical protein
MDDDVKVLLTSDKLKDFKKGLKISLSRCDESAASLILARLEKLDLERSWEISCDALKALGLNRYKPATDIASKIWRNGEEHSMVVAAAAEAYVRIERADLTDASPVMAVLEHNGYSQVEGALDALGYDRMIPEDSIVQAIVMQCWDFGFDRDKRGLGDPRYGLVAACAGWLNIPNVKEFLLHCKNTGDEPVKYVAEKSLEGIYVKLR